MRKSFSELNPQLTSSSSSNQISILQKFIRSILHTITVNSHHPSTIRIFLLLLAFLDVRQQLKLLKHSTDGKAIPTSDGVTDASSSVWCQSSAISWGADKGESLLRLFVHSILQLPALGQLIGNYVNSFLVNYSIDVISKGKINGKNVAESVNSYIEQLVVLLLDCFYENCKEILIVNESRSCLDRNNRISITANFVDINKTAIDADPFDDSKGKIHNSSVVEDNLLFAVRSIIREQLEIELFVPISNNINYLLKLSTGTEEQLIRSHVHNLKRQPQSYYGIPLHQISLTGWASVIEKLQTIRIHLLPISRIEALLSLAKTITKLYKEEHADCTEPFGADDMFPVFLYIIVNSDLTYVLALSLELQIFCDSEKKLGEMGYYLATLEAALDHLLRTDKIGVDEVID